MRMPLKFYGNSMLQSSVYGDDFNFFKKHFANSGDIAIFADSKTVGIAQLVRASDCGSEGRGFEPHYLPGFFFRLSRN